MGILSYDETLVSSDPILWLVEESLDYGDGITTHTFTIISGDDGTIATAISEAGAWAMIHDYLEGYGGEED